MIRVEINRETCKGYANCVLAAESVFDLDDDGLVILKNAEPGDAELEAVRQAAYGCPTDSITVTTSEPDAA